MRMLIKGLIRMALCVAGALGAGYAWADTNETLCVAGEDIYFSCPLNGGKIVSICASGNNSPDSGYVQYRYGTGKKIEIIYPGLKESPRNKLFYVDATEGNAGNEILKFDIGSYRYFIRQAYFSGLLVKKNNREVFRQTCEDSRYANISRGAVRGIQHKNKSDEDF